MRRDLDEAAVVRIEAAVEAIDAEIAHLPLEVRNRVSTHLHAVGRELGIPFFESEEDEPS